MPELHFLCFLPNLEDVNQHRPPTPRLRAALGLRWVDLLDLQESPLALPVPAAGRPLGHRGRPAPSPTTQHWAWPWSPAPPHTPQAVVKMNSSAGCQHSLGLSHFFDNHFPCHCSVISSCAISQLSWGITSPRRPSLTALGTVRCPLCVLPEPYSGPCQST